jgi:hypothetical protein
MSSTDFDHWLARLPQKGYDRDWIRRNEPALRVRFAVDQSEMPPCPQPSVALRDRYEEL